MDASARVTMKDAAKCDKRREWQNSVNQENAERILRFWVTPAEHVCFRAIHMRPVSEDIRIMQSRLVASCVSVDVFPLTHEIRTRI